MSNKFVAPLLVFCLFLALAATGHAASPSAFVKSFGDIEVVALLDVANSGNPDLLIGLSDEDKAKLAPDAMANSINAFAVKLNGKTYLFDTGLGKNGSRQGSVLESLRSAGISPYQVDAVIITHFHGDHIGGLTWGGRPVFPLSDLYVAKEEVEKWQKKEDLAFLDLYGDKVKKFDIGGEVVPGVLSLDAKGHTLGHTAFAVETDSGKILIAGDVIHFANVQMAKPGVAVKYDTDPEAAVKARKRIFDLAVADKYPIAAMHIAFPGIGTLEQDGDGYKFTPIK